MLVVAHIAGTLAPGYGLLFATRVVSALAYAGFWGLVAAAVILVPESAKSLTLATIVGVPAGTV
ncbi:hypothetical protein AB0D99_00600 [Streptomyces sp. NPDC047971]|uniref:hypothetical protein n=1 Tax=Streptomyces sp. NPDC047971 TaxID=3154499 RepID=UPI0033E816D8